MLHSLGRLHVVSEGPRLHFSQSLYEAEGGLHGVFTSRETGRLVVCTVVIRTRRECVLIMEVS